MRRQNRIYLIVAVAALFVGAHDAPAHEATTIQGKPLGWSYPFACCSSMDCREVSTNHSDPGERVFETGIGYRFSTSNEVIEYGDKRIKDSPDGRFHWCTEDGKSNGKTICLFVPPRGF